MNVIKIYLAKVQLVFLSILRVFIFPLGFSFALMLPIIALAYDEIPEFHSLNEAEQSQFEGPDQLGSEYAADLLSYRKPSLWNYQWLKNKNVLEADVGSTGPSHYALRNRLKLSKALTSDLEFLFYYYQFQDRETDTEAISIFEFKQRIYLRAFISLYASTDMFKRQNDYGVALSYQFRPNHEIRIFHTLVDMVRIKRNDRNDRFVEAYEPKSSGIVGRLWRAKKENFLEYSLREESETHWEFLDENLLYKYKKYLASIKFRHSIGEAYFNSKIQFDRKYESQTAINSSAVAERSWTTKRFLSTNSYETENWEFGLDFSLRSWNTLNEGKANYYDYLPFIRYQLSSWKFKQAKTNFDFEYLVTVHKERGSEVLRGVNTQKSKTENRLNIVWNLLFSESSHLRILLSADIDEFGNSVSWDGGNLQFRAKF